MKFKTVIFDLDGTLVDSLPVIASTITDVLKEFNIEISLEKAISMIGLPTENIFGFFIKDSIQRDTAIELFDTRIDNRTRELKIFAGIKDLLLLLSKAGVNMSIFTNRGKESSMEILKQNDIDSIFDLIVSRDDVQNLKPNPEGIFKILQYFKTDNKDALFIGDSIHDKKAGIASSVPTMIINTSKNYFSEEDKVIKIVDLEILYNV